MVQMYKKNVQKKCTNVHQVRAISYKI